MRHHPHADSSEPEKDSFPYEQLLAYYRDEIADLEESSRITERLTTDLRWKAHFESIADLDLERVAAIQDGVDLEDFTPPKGEEHFCMAVARSQGKLLLPLIQGNGDTGGFTRKQWSVHLNRCVYCRRMRRQLFAQVARDQLRNQGILPEGELLMRDWLLEEYYAGGMEKTTRKIVGMSEAASSAATVATSAAAPAVLLLHFGGGKFIALQSNGTRSDLGSSPKGRFGVWDYSSGRIRGRSAAPALLAEGEAPPERMRLEFARQLATGRGKLEIRFSVLSDDSVICEVTLTRSDLEQAPASEVTVQVDFHGTEWLRVSGADRVLHAERSLPNIKLLSGKQFHFRVFCGGDVWEDSSFQFQG